VRIDKGLIVAIVIALGCSAAGAWLLHEQRTGEKVVATITDCHHVSTGRGGGSTICNGSWVAGGDGSLLGGGHVVLGSVHGADEGDIDKKLAVRAHGDHAYRPSDKTPLALFGLGLAFLAIGGFAARKRAQTAAVVIANDQDQQPE
jgi:hypothetical protein